MGCDKNADHVDPDGWAKTVLHCISIGIGWFAQRSLIILKNLHTLRGTTFCDVMFVMLFGPLQ